MASLLQALLRNESGGRNVPNVHEGTSSGQAQGYFQITTGTWKDFGGEKYAPNPLKASYQQQADIASRIPLKRWDKSTLRAMQATGKPIDPSLTLGQNLAIHGENFGSMANEGGGSNVSAMKFPYRLEGGGRRPDAISGMQQPFNQALLAMYQAAPPEVQRELGIASGYRSNKVQTALWNASDKTGRTVARPGSSKHEHGTAADLFGFGLKNAGNVSQATKDWVHQNAGQFGLYFPMDYEPWHIQLKDTSGLRHVGGAGSSAASFGQNTIGGGGGPGVNIDPTGSPGMTPESLGNLLAGTELTGEDKDKPLGGLLSDMMKAPEPMAPLPPMQLGQQPAGPSLPEYIQQFMAARMRGQPPPTGGAGGMGGQGIG